MSKLITSSEQFEALRRAGVFEDNPTMIRRVVIDLQEGVPARFYIERFADSEQLQAGLEAMIRIEET